MTKSDLIVIHGCIVSIVIVAIGAQISGIDWLIDACFAALLSVNILIVIRIMSIRD